MPQMSPMNWTMISLMTMMTILMMSTLAPNKSHKKIFLSWNINLFKKWSW